MNFPQAIFASALVLSVAIVFSELTPEAKAEMKEAKFEMEKSDAGVWRINSYTGQVSHCTFELDKENQLIVRCLDWAN